MKALKWIAVLTAALVLAPAVSRADDIFTFDGLAIGSNSPFLGVPADLGSGLTADFGATANSGAFQIGDNSPFMGIPFYAFNMSGNVLAATTFPSEPLEVKLSEPRKQLTFEFALYTPGALQIDIPSLGVSLLSTAGPQKSPFTLYEGSFSYTSLPGFFDVFVVLSPTGSNYVLDNVRLSQVPEPGTLALALGALAPLAWRVRRRPARRR